MKKVMFIMGFFLTVSLSLAAEMVSPGEPGTQVAHTVNGVTFMMRLAPAGVFPSGWDDDKISIVQNEFWIAETSEATSAAGWYNKNSNGTTQAVGQKPATGNALGLYDMSGNVWEYCYDRYGKSELHRIIRGGSWLSYSLGLGTIDTAEYGRK